MSKEASEGNVKLYWLPACANIAAPTVAEIAAGTNLTPFLPTSGLAIDSNENNASIAMIDSGHTDEQVGTYSTSVALTLVRDAVSADDDAWTLFVRGLSGFLLKSPFGAPVATSRVEVYPCEAHEPVPLPPAENEFQQFRVTLAVHTTPNRKAVVAA